MIKTPYLLFLGDAPDQLAAKVAIGIKDWRPENAVAQFVWRDAARILALQICPCKRRRMQGPRPWSSVWQIVVGLFLRPGKWC